MNSGLDASSTIAVAAMMSCASLGVGEGELEVLRQSGVRLVQHARAVWESGSSLIASLSVRRNAFSVRASSVLSLVTRHLAR